MLTELSGVLTAFNGMRAAITGVVDLRDATKLAELKLTLINQLADLQIRLLAVLATADESRVTIEQLKAQVAKLESDRDDRREYQLRTVEGSSALAYLYVPTGSDPRENQVAHILCQACWDAGRKSVLQRSVNGNIFSCPESDAHELRIRSSMGRPIKLGY